MNKIMIVDDMPIFLEYLRGCIDWNSYGFEICCEAHDGKEALEKMDEFLPDVVLTDITMPYLNGLELSEKIMQNYPDTSIILITGNNEFEYARKAVKIGVCDYIVKPFEKEELILSLLKLQDNIGKAVENDIEKESQTDNSEQEKFRQIIYSAGSVANEEIYSELNDSGKYPLLAVCSVNQNARNFRMELEQIMNWEKMFVRMLQGRIEIDGTYRLFNDYENNIVIIFSFKTEEARAAYKGYEFVDLSQIIKNQLELDMLTCFGVPENGYEGIHDFYEKILVTMAEKTTESVIDMRIPKTGKEFMVKPQISLNAIMRLNHDLETLQDDDAAKTISDIWEKMKESSLPMADINILSGAVGVLMTNIIQSGFSIEAIYGKGFSPEKELMSLKTREEMRDKIIELYRIRINYQKNKTDSKSHNIAVAAKEYIEEHYADNGLSIADISEHLLVNQTYLRRMFKAEMDMTLQEYMTQYRMHKAKKMILETDEKLAEIAENVGYSDVSYFSNCFKKFYGVSPRSMQNKLL
ncbi:response regulator transcription factor [Butyrivibrio sp. WCD3002]|uniref:response regulator transcription factor n=1 Tax=Butyrivibrio sp. WCD3002 TaxID=1280676 RepID=UPI000414B9DA|nr:response regulator [Butyrivibrio sp. WCD3002]